MDENLAPLAPIEDMEALAKNRHRAAVTPWIVSATVLLAWGGVTAAFSPWLSEGALKSQGILSLFVVGNVFAGIMWLWTVCRQRSIQITHFGTMGVILVGAMMRLILIPSTPIWESDYYRYLWDGAQVAHGINPYFYRPQDIQAVLDQGRSISPAIDALAREGGDIIRRINHPDVRTIYPPVAQFFFGLAHWISPWSVTAWRGVLLGCDVATLAFLLHLLRKFKLPLVWAAIYWWNPLAVKEVYNAAHLDVIVLPMVLAAILAATRGRTVLASAALALAVGAKLWPVVLLPVLLRARPLRGREAVAALAVFAGLVALLLSPMWLTGPAGFDGVRLYATAWQANDGLFLLQQHFWRGLLAILRFRADLAEPITRWTTVVILAAWVAWLARKPFTWGEDLVEAALLTVAVLFMLNPAQFPWYATWMLPLLALRPRLSLMLYTVLLLLYPLTYIWPDMIWAEHLPIYCLLAYEVLYKSRPKTTPSESNAFPDPPVPAVVSVVIPALNEAAALGRVLEAIPRWVHQVIVADNGSTDGTAAIARRHGALVVSEPRRGYGFACQAALATMDPAEIVVFLDADFSDQPREMQRLVQPIIQDDMDLVIGSRVLGERDPGSLTLQQRFGNALACRLIRLFFGVRFTDLGPFRAVRFSALKRLKMTDCDYGWTVQMQVRAVRSGLRVAEVPVSYRRRIGRSKISGTLRGILGAGTRIISTIVREAWDAWKNHRLPSGERLLVFARYPTPGRVKTRLIPLLGEAGAANLHRQLVRMTLQTARRLATARRAQVEMRSTGGEPSKMRKTLAPDFCCRDQGAGSLGDRLERGITEAFTEGSQRVVVVGADSPLLSAHHLEQAFDALADHDLVLGPAQDGGYYLLGLRQPHPELFVKIPWGEPSVLRETLAASHRLGLNVHLLKPLPDIDTPDDLKGWGGTRLVRPGETPRLSVVIPALNEEAHIASAIASVLSCRDCEVIVVDGRSQDRTAEIARQFGAKVFHAAPSRSGQVNVGANHARASALLFLHADTVLPENFVLYVQSILSQPHTAAGAFRLKIDGPGLGLRMIETAVRMRTSWMGMPYGDQALFMSSETFRACAGFPDLPCMEDYAMLSRLRAQGCLRAVDATVSTSARQWMNGGLVRTTLRHQGIIFKYRLGLHLKTPLSACD